MKAQRFESWLHGAPTTKRGPVGALATRSRRWHYWQRQRQESRHYCRLMMRVGQKVALYFS